MIAVFRPQAWVNDYAVDVDPPGPTEWNISPRYLSSLTSKKWREPSSYARDELRLDPAAPEWVRDYAGPFEVDIPELDDESEPTDADMARQNPFAL